ncbi:MAG: hypothetical protein HZB53_14030 [Chloroflexi bacterium]|nr:hypothetical protein [Chloroflexota bacterium]
MSNVKRTRRAVVTSPAASRRRLIVLGTVAMAAVAIVVWWSTARSDTAAGFTSAIGSQVSANPLGTDIPGLQAAEQGTAGQPVLVWFHADW